MVFFGTPAFAVPALSALLRSRHRVVAAVTQPDRPRGRGHRTMEMPVKALASAEGLPVLQPDRLKEAVFWSSLAAFGADLGVVAAYGKILPEELLALPRLGMVNVHASLLPRYRGAAPVHRAVMAGDRETGVTIMRVVKALDAGPMLAWSVRPIGPDETSEQVEQDLARIGADLLVDIVDRLGHGPVPEVHQDDARATYAPRLTKEDGRIDWSLSADRIHNLVRGLHPWPHAFSFLDGRRFILLETEVVVPKGDEKSTPAPSAPVGAVLEAAGDRLTVATGEGALRVVLIRPEDKRALSARELLAGYRIRVGDRFVSGP